MYWCYALLATLALWTGVAHAEWDQSAQFAGDGKTVLAHNVLWRLPEGREIRRYQTPFCGLAPNGRFVVTSDGKSLEFWDIASGMSQQRVELKTGALDLRVVVWPMCALVSGGREFMLAAEDEYKITFHVFDSQSGKLLRKIATSADSFTTGRIARDGNTFVLGSELNGKPVTEVWSVATGKIVRRFEGDLRYDAKGAAFSPDGKVFVFGTKDKTARLIDVATGKTLGEVGDKSDEIVALAFSFDSRQLLLITDDITSTHVTLWNVASKKETHSIQTHGLVKSVTFSPDNRLIALSDDDQTRLLEFTSQTAGNFTALLDPAHDAVWNVAFSNDGKRVLSAGRDTLTDEAYVRVWDVETGKLLQRFAGVRGAFSPDGSTLALAGEDGALRLVEAETGKEIRTFEKLPHAAQVMAFSSDGKKIVVECNTTKTYDWNDWKIRLLDVNGVLPTRELIGMDLRLSPNNRWIAFTAGKYVGTWVSHVSAGNIELLDLDADVLGKAAARQVSIGDQPTAITNSGERLLVSDWNKWNKLYLWNIAAMPPTREKEISLKTGYRAATFSPLGSFLLLPFDDTLGLVSVDSGEVVREFQGNSAVFSPNGKTVLVGTRSGAARLYKIATGEQIQDFKSVIEKMP